MAASRVKNELSICWIVKISGCGAEFKCMHLNKQKSFSELRFIDAESFCQEKKWMKGREIRGCGCGALYLLKYS